MHVLPLVIAPLLRAPSNQAMDALLQNKLSGVECLEHVVDTVLENLDFTPLWCNNIEQNMLWEEMEMHVERRGMLLLMLTNKGWVDGNGSNPGGRFGKPGGGQETRGGGDGLEGPDG
ncbi:hypothetical protein Tco_0643275 [Tanacetum coccineum]